MKREIKFRVWDKDYKEMHICGENGHDSMQFINGVTCYYNLQNGCGSLTDGSGTYDLLQYTGLKDKNGKEIYEGDIVTAWSEGSFGKFEVKFREDGGGTPCWLLYPAWQNNQMWSLSASREEDGQVYDRGIEVIGNIYENPGLLEVKMT